MKTLQIMLFLLFCGTASAGDLVCHLGFCGEAKEGMVIKGNSGNAGVQEDIHAKPDYSQISDDDLREIGDLCREHVEYFQTTDYYQAKPGWEPCVDLTKEWVKRQSRWAREEGEAERKKELEAASKSPERKRLSEILNRYLGK